MANNATSFVNSHPICLISPANFDPYNPIRPDTVNPTWTVLATVSGLTALPTAGVNSLIAWTVFSDENLRISPFNFLLGELAVSDMLVGLVVQPLYSAVFGCLVNYCYSPCQFTACILALLACNGTTLVTLALACAERYLAIEHPNLYNRIVTGEKAQKVAVISWISSLVYLVTSTILLSIFHPSLTKVPFAILTALCAGIILFSCSKVQLTAYRQQRAIDVQQQAPISQNSMQIKESETQARRRRELKQVFTMTVLVIMSVILITPVVIVTAIELTTNQDAEFKYLAIPICFSLVNLQSLVNPAILALRLSYIQNGMKKKIAFLKSLLPFGQ